MLEKELEVTTATSDLNYLERKNIQLRGEIQCLNDRIAGLVKENNNLRREAIASKVVLRTVGDIKDFAVNLKQFIGQRPNKELPKELEDDKN